MSKNRISIHLVFKMMEKEMPNLYGALDEIEGLVFALKGIGFKGWKRILNDQGILRMVGEEVFDDDLINIHFQEGDFIERSDAWGTVVALIKDRGKALDQFTISRSLLERSRVHTEWMPSGHSSSLEKRKQDRDIFLKHSSHQERGYDRILSLDESDELKNMSTKPLQHPRVGQMYLDMKVAKVFVWNGKKWKDSGDRIKT